VQVADRRHVLRNLGEALQNAVDRHRRGVREAARALAPRRSAASSGIPAMAKRDRLRNNRRRHRRELYETMRVLKERGLTIEGIAAAVGRSPLTVRRWLGAGGPPMHSKPRQPGTLDGYAAFLDRRLREGCRSASRLWCEVRAQGFGGGERTVRRWVQRHRHVQGKTAKLPAAMVKADWSAPSSRRCARLLAMPADRLTDDERTFLAHLRETAPTLVRAGEIAANFAGLLRDRRDQPGASLALNRWIAGAQGSDLESFARGLERDYAAVCAALIEPWSTSPVEGQINRLKMLKRMMYGRAKLDLLRQRVLAAA
jgi:transposase